MFFSKKKNALLRIGPTTAVDINTITAIYRIKGDLIIRFGGIGIIKLSGSELYKPVKDTFEDLLSRTTLAN